MKSRLAAVRDTHFQNDQQRNDRKTDNQPPDQKEWLGHFVGRLVIDDRLHVVGTRITQQFLDTTSVKTFVLCIDVDEETIIGDPVEPRVGEDRVTELWQTIQGPHAEESTERREQHRQFKGDRHEGRQRDVRLTGDDVGIINSVHPDLHHQGGDRPRQTGSENNPGQYRGFDPQRLIDPVHGERSKRIGFFITCIADSPASIQ